MPEPWLLLALVGAALTLAEFFTPGFVSLPAGLAFFGAAALAPVLRTWPALFAALAALLLASYAICYWIVWPRLKKTAPRTAAAGMVGKIAIVVEPIDRTGQGYVRLYGDTWKAVSEELYPVGAKVIILATEGNKVVVGPSD